MPEGRRRGPLLGLGVVILVGGLVAALALWFAAGQRRSNAIENLARAPVGCDTTLDFAEGGAYFLFVETQGELDEIRGDCDVVGAYDASESGLGESFRILDPDGESLDLDLASDGPSYSQDGFTGAAAVTFEVADAGDHVVRVESSSDEVFVAAVGRDPDDGVAALQLGAGVTAALALVVGGLALVLGARRGSAPAASPTAGPAPGSWSAPSTFTPGQAPPGPPVYGRPSSPPMYGQGPSAPPTAPPGAFGTPPLPPPPVAGGTTVPTAAPPPPPSPGWATTPPVPPAPPAPPAPPPTTPSTPASIPGEAGFRRPPSGPASEAGNAESGTPPHGDADVGPGREDDPPSTPT